jgi:sigma-E factor negative regulatory protein RseA
MKNYNHCSANSKGVLMEEPMNEKLSLLIDDELPSYKALDLLRAVGKDEALQQRLQRYHLISQVLKNEDCYLVHKQFAAKIHQQISGEPYFLIPPKRAAKNWQKIGLAIAASITLAVVWLAYNYDAQKYSYPPSAPMAMNQQAPVELEPLNARFNDYLQAHDNDVYSNHVPRVQPYARVVGYQQQ